MEKIQFEEIYIERIDKESDEVIANETSSFLDKSITFLKDKSHVNEYVFLDIDVFSKIGIDGLSIEMDDLFHTYSVMFGLPAQKKKETVIKAFFQNKLRSDEPKFAAMFNQTDGVWDINFNLDYLEGFKEDLSFQEALILIYDLLNELLSSMKEG